MAATESRVIRVFLSSTFVDFEEERRLLVQQVFPNLRRRARPRGVDLVDVDLRWGVTAEQTERGETLPLCLAEIDRCRPYFIGLLGERYGWVPPPEFYQPELLERQPWLQERMGGSSVTELEILHGVLRNPEMAGHAFFYLRHPAHSHQQSEPGWVAESESERQKLELLKEKVRCSGFPVREGLPDPGAIAARVEADLWAVIEQRYPEEEQPDRLAREERKHSDYRRSRTDVYLGGEGYIQDLEQRIEAGEQRLLITGESGLGKSALIANWVERHQEEHPQDLVYCHHLGCTSDSNTVRPLVARLIDTASRFLEEEHSEPLKVPEDWWELVFKVGETLALLSSWCQRHNQRWIWVLDGLDRLESDEQKAMPWLPSTIPPGIHVVATALDCPARLILQQRSYQTLTISPLQRQEQEALIKQYLDRFTKQLEEGLRELIIDHPLSGSPLFLRVLLEELRQCGTFDILHKQLDFYLGAKTVADLYGRVLERLEQDGHDDMVRKVMTALWASRTGLSETELLSIAELAPLQWSPLYLALEQAFGRNGNRLVFDHDYLRKAVEDRYITSTEQRKQTHEDLANWFEASDANTERQAEEVPWQLQQAGLLNKLQNLLFGNALKLVSFVYSRGSMEVLQYWQAVHSDADGSLDELLAKQVEEEIINLKNDTDKLIWFADGMAKLLDDAGLHRDLLLRLRTLSLCLEETSDGRSKLSTLASLSSLAGTFHDLGRHEQAGILFQRSLESSEQLLGMDHPATLNRVNDLAQHYKEVGDLVKAEMLFLRCIETKENMLGKNHPDTLNSVSNLGGLYYVMEELAKAKHLLRYCLDAREKILGLFHQDTLRTLSDMGAICHAEEELNEGESLLRRSLDGHQRLLGPKHPFTLVSISNLASIYMSKGDFEQAEFLYKHCLESREQMLGKEHPDTLISLGILATLYAHMHDFRRAYVLYARCLKAQKRLLGIEHQDTTATMYNLAVLCRNNGKLNQSEVLFKQCLEAQERLFGQEHAITLTTLSALGYLYQKKQDYTKAVDLLRRSVEARERVLGSDHPKTQLSRRRLSDLLAEKAGLSKSRGHLKPS